MVFSPLYCSSDFGTSCFRSWKTLYICIMAVYFVSSYVVEDPCIEERLIESEEEVTADALLVVSLHICWINRKEGMTSFVDAAQIG